MPAKTRAELRAEFANGQKTNEDKYADIFDSFISVKDDGLNVTYDSVTRATLLGINVTKPSAPLTILAAGEDQRVISFAQQKEEITWGIDLAPTKDTPGFNIVERDKNQLFNRLFIRKTKGHVGIGTIVPTRRLSVHDNVPDGFTGIKVLNDAASVFQQGWTFAHGQNNSLSSRNGILAILEESGSGAIERFTVQPVTGFIGINALIPDTQLHVERPVADPDALAALRSGTGIAEFGQVTQSVLIDYKGIKARSGEYINNTIKFSPAALNLQDYGGDLYVHGSADVNDEQKFVIKDNGNVGIGIVDPQEQLHIKGRLIVGKTDAALAVPGSIQWTGTEFQGYNGTDWVSFTGDTTFWTSAGTDKITYNAATSMVGIGIDIPAATLDVSAHGEVDGSSVGARIANTATSTTDDATKSRVALQVRTDGNFSLADEAKDVALYALSNGSGPAHTRIAALLNGNTVLGAPDNAHGMVGNGGLNVLVIQNGTEPSTRVGDPAVANSGIQIYSSNVNEVATFTVMNGNEEVIRLFKAAAPTAAVTETIDTTYGTEEAAVLSNLRTRVAYLESLLRGWGLMI